MSQVSADFSRPSGSESQNEDLVECFPGAIPFNVDVNLPKPAQEEAKQQPISEEKLTIQDIVHLC